MDTAVVLIPDLMGLFWIQPVTDYEQAEQGLNPRFDGAFLNCKDKEQARFKFKS